MRRRAAGGRSWRQQLLAADGLLQRNLFKLAADAYEQFLRDYPQNAQITAGRYGLAICRYRLGQFDAAAPLLRQALADAQFGQADQALALLGYCELSTKNYDDAIGHFDQLIASYPQERSGGSGPALPRPVAVPVG